jgi:hypothetical protein
MPDSHNATCESGVPAACRLTVFGPISSRYSKISGDFLRKVRRGREPNERPAEAGLLSPHAAFQFGIGSRFIEEVDQPLDRVARRTAHKARRAQGRCLAVSIMSRYSQLKRETHAGPPVRAFARYWPRGLPRQLGRSGIADSWDNWIALTYGWRISRQMARLRGGNNGARRLEYPWPPDRNM